MTLPTKKQVFRYSYLVIIGFLIGVFVGMNFIQSGQARKSEAALKARISEQKRMIDGLLQNRLEKN